MKIQKLSTALLIIFLFAGSGHSIIRRTLIDFSKYDQNVKAQYTDPADSYITNIDGNPKVVLGYKDYLLDNWRVDLNETSQSTENKIYSYAKSVASQRFDTTLGIRVHFPKWANNSYVVVKPPFPIKIYDENGQYANAENGVMPNVSEIKTLSIWVNGRNYRYGLSIRLLDRLNVMHEYFMGWLYFDGWRKLVWDNPNYTEKVSAKTLTREPLYPFDIPFMTFDSLVIYRPSDQIGGDFVCYFKSIDIEYSPFVVDTTLTEDIKDEEVWGIITTQARKKRDIEDKRFVEDLYLYQQEKRRIQAAKDDFNKSGNNNTND
jgi:hypothetical protein